MPLHLTYLSIYLSILNIQNYNMYSNLQTNASTTCHPLNPWQSQILMGCSHHPCQYGQYKVGLLDNNNGCTQYHYHA